MVLLHKLSSAHVLSSLLPQLISTAPFVVDAFAYSRLYSLPLHSVVVLFACEPKSTWPAYLWESLLNMGVSSVDLAICMAVYIICLKTSFNPPAGVDHLNPDANSHHYLGGHNFLWGTKFPRIYYTPGNVVYRHCQGVQFF